MLKKSKWFGVWEFGQEAEKTGLGWGARAQVSIVVHRAGSAKRHLAGGTHSACDCGNSGRRDARFGGHALLPNKKIQRPNRPPPSLSASTTTSHPTPHTIS